MDDLTKAEAYRDAYEILNEAVSECLTTLQKDWSPDAEMGFVMVRRAMRHLTHMTSDDYRPGLEMY